MKRLPLNNAPGQFAIVDDDDYEYLSRFIWTMANGYAQRSKRRREKEFVNLAMHRMITRCPKELVVDHINFDKLDNRKENLRVVTREENSSHQPTSKKKLTNIIDARIPNRLSLGESESDFDENKYYKPRKRQISFYITESEKVKVREYIKQLRSG